MNTAVDLRALVLGPSHQRVVLDPLYDDPDRRADAVLGSLGGELLGQSAEVVRPLCNHPGAVLTGQALSIGAVLA